MLFMLSTSTALAQDVGAGETSFRKCRGCHSIGVGAQNKIGPPPTHFSDRFFQEICP
jgi:cytochrome c